MAVAGLLWLMRHARGCCRAWKWEQLWQLECAARRSPAERGSFGGPGPCGFPLPSGALQGRQAGSCSGRNFRPPPLELIPGLDSRKRLYERPAQRKNAVAARRLMRQKPPRIRAHFVGCNCQSSSAGGLQTVLAAAYPYLGYGTRRTACGCGGGTVCTRSFLPDPLELPCATNLHQVPQDSLPEPWGGALIVWEHAQVLSICLLQSWPQSRPPPPPIICAPACPHVHGLPLSSSPECFVWGGFLRPATRLLQPLPGCMCPFRPMPLPVPLPAHAQTRCG